MIPHTQAPCQACSLRTCPPGCARPLSAAQLLWGFGREGLAAAADCARGGVKPPATRTPHVRAQAWLSLYAAHQCIAGVAHTRSNCRATPAWLRLLLEQARPSRGVDPGIRTGSEVCEDARAQQHKKNHLMLKRRPRWAVLAAHGRAAAAAAQACSEQEATMPALALG